MGEKKLNDLLCKACLIYPNTEETRNNLKKFKINDMYMTTTEKVFKKEKNIEGEINKLVNYEFYVTLDVNLKARQNVNSMIAAAKHIVRDNILERRRKE
ncbi:MAG TPA: hypothetical protein DCP90_03585 [Clostridiales bacterium]|nr:MAG: hypothetical protein A2Y22_03655 [Clostridiales bacterium GWD2_32_59]HAN09677.1 hypothetical protein [Clostridiales bacterium]